MNGGIIMSKKKSNHDIKCDVVSCENNNSEEGIKNSISLFEDSL